MVDPETSTFWASWQNDERALEDVDIVGAENAIAWGRERADVVMIRLGHRGDTYFSAGAVYDPDDSDEPPHPAWPPLGPPPGGWYTPEEEL
jgi:hypothetical protein